MFMNMLFRCDRVPDIRKIAVLRANALGDFIFALPALEVLRVAYPEAEIVLLAKKWHANFLVKKSNKNGPDGKAISCIIPSDLIYFSTCNRGERFVHNMLVLSLNLWRAISLMVSQCPYQY